jgi:hypothetical protein
MSTNNKQSCTHFSCVIGMEATAVEAAAAAAESFTPAPMREVIMHM